MLSFTHLAALATVVVVVWTAYGVVWRLFWSPISKFPGPKLAALTLWYEFYFDVVQSGMYIWEIERLHKTYGPIVRISPYELHINDPNFYEEIYASNTRIRDKYEWQIKSGDSAQAMGFTVSHELHRERRQAVDRFFSTQSVNKLEDVIQGNIQKLCTRIEEYRQARKIINLTEAFLALTMDIIQSYSFGESSNLLDLPDFSPEWRHTITGILSKTSLLNHCGWLPMIIHLIPEKIIEAVEPSLAMMNGLKRHIAQLVNQVAQRRDITSKPQYRTIFDGILDDEQLSVQEKTLTRLTDEAAILVIAASETPAKVLALIMFYLAKRPDLVKKIREELDTAFAVGKAPALHRLEQMPYLSAVVKEGLRLHGGIVARSQRLCRHESLRYGDFEIPPGTPLSTSSHFVHRNPELFPEPSKFWPERWIQKNEVHVLDRYLVAFGKGTRNCVGKNLGQAELYLTLSAVVKQFDFEPFETTEADVDIGRDRYVMQPRNYTSQGVRMIVKENDDLVRGLLTVVSPSKPSTYEILPVELQYKVVDLMHIHDLSAFCFVNQHAYALTLRRRYHSIRLTSSSIAKAFSQHALHNSFGNLSFVRFIFVNISPGTSSAEVESFRTAVDKLSRESLRSVFLRIESGADYPSFGIPQLFGMQTNVRRLTVAYPEDYCPEIDEVLFPNLEHLILCATRSMLLRTMYIDFGSVILRGISRSIRKLDVGCITDSQGLFYGTCLGSLGEALPNLKSVTLRHIMLKEFNWRMFGERGLESLVLLHCQGLAYTRESLSVVAPTWCCLHKLIFVLPEMQIHLNPAALQLVEDVLHSLPCTSLGHLKIEVPAAGRLPDAACIARHEKLESLVVTVTDGDGRWMAFPLNDMGMIRSQCVNIQCIGLTLPSPERWSDFFISARFPCITAILVIGIEDSSPRLSAPAWIRHCPNQAGSGEDEVSIHATAKSIFNLSERLSEADGILHRLKVGIHIGPYYCRDWMQDMTLFVRDDGMPGRVDMSNLALVSAELEVISRGGYASAGLDGGHVCG